VTQNASDWRRAAAKAVRQATASLKDKSAVAAVGLSTQGATMLAADADGNPLCPAITWMDKRAARETAELIETFGAETLYRKAGWYPGPTLDAPKIAWMRRHEPKLFQEAAVFVSTLEFMNFFLTGRYVIDPTNAAIRQLIDVRTGRWDSEIHTFLELDETRLPEIAPAGASLGNLTAEAAEALGLPQSARVYNGAHDQYCAAIGCGALAPGNVLLSTGTTWVALAVAERLLYTEAHFAAGVFPLSDRFAVMASMVSAGSALKWWKNVIGADYAEIDAEAAKRMESAADLLFYPYLAGAGALHAPDARAALVGMTLRHDRFDAALALMEGVAFEARLLLEEFARSGVKADELILTGGAANSRLWLEIVACVTGAAVWTAENADGACLGAAMLAAVGFGAYPNLEACAKAAVRRRPLEAPVAARRAFYEEKFQRYRKGAPMAQKERGKK
jgi:sugar (pentulose or hexulose) kinase